METKKNKKKIKHLLSGLLELVRKWELLQTDTQVGICFRIDLSYLLLPRFTEVSKMLISNILMEFEKINGWGIGAVFSSLFLSLPVPRGAKTKMSALGKQSI